jgi:hypothetical protein
MEQLMEGHWIKPTLAAVGVLFAIGGAVGAFLQAKWLHDQRKTLQVIVDTLHAMRGGDMKGVVSNPMTPSRTLKA